MSWILKETCIKSIKHISRKKDTSLKKLDFTDPIRSDHYNPLEHIENSQDIVKISHMLIYGDGGYRRVSPFWDESSQMLLQSNRIDEAVAGETRMFCNILRDADKVDILRVNVETTMEEIYNVSEVELLTSGVSEKVMDQVREHHAVNRDVMDSPAEHLIGHIALAFELVYPKSWEIAKEQRYIYKMFDFPSRNESTLKALEDTREELKVFYGDVS